MSDGYPVPCYCDGDHQLSGLDQRLALPGAIGSQAHPHNQDNND